MDGKPACDTRTVAELAKAIVALELEMTNDLAAEYRRLSRHHSVCVELTARGAWSEAGPLIDREVALLRKELAPKCRR